MLSQSVRDQQPFFPKQFGIQRHRRIFSNGSERRQATRFPVHLAVRYRINGQFGNGEVLNMSSSGVFFTAEHSFNPGDTVELFISWPVLLHNSVPLNLVATGPIVRTDTGRAAVKIHKYEFRTCKSSALKRETMPAPQAKAPALFRTAGAFGGQTF